MNLGKYVEVEFLNEEADDRANPKWMCSRVLGESKIRRTGKNEWGRVADLTTGLLGFGGEDRQLRHFFMRESQAPSRYLT